MRLEFRLDELSLREDIECEPGSADSAVLETTYFMMPVRFSIEDTELLGLGDDPWSELPLIGFATLLRETADLADGQTRRLCFAAGDLSVERKKAKVRVSSILRKTGAELDVAEFAVATAQFLVRTRDFLVEHVPALRNHSEWGAWFPSGR
jgi:hypothetical protein